MYNYYQPEEIAEHARQELSVSRKTAIRKAQEYQQKVFQELVSGFFLANMKQISQGELPFSLERIKRSLGRYGSGGKNYWWDWLHKNYPIVQVIKKGNSIKGLLTMVKSEIIPIDIIVAGGNRQEVFENLYNQYPADSERHCVKIDQTSLKNYIAATQAQNSANQTIINNLQEAKRILMIAEYTGGVLPQIVNRSRFGRIYYRGPNLQSCHKTVREAALGKCHLVDINSAVFTWKYSLVDDNQGLSYTRELLNEKNRVRKTLARIAFDTDEPYYVNLIKQTMTAIGFGARLTKNAWFQTTVAGELKWTQGSISDIIKSKDARDRLLESEWMTNFMQEQKTIDAIIVKEMRHQLETNEMVKQYREDFLTPAGRLSESKMIAWAYQQSEQAVMKKMAQAAGAEILLQVHDGLYFKTKPDVASMQTELQLQWPIAKISHETIEPYRYANVIEITDHRERIHQEEKKANAGVDPRTTGIQTEKIATRKYNSHAEPDWEIYMNHLAQEYEEQYNSRPESIKRLMGQ